MEFSGVGEYWPEGQFWNSCPLRVEVSTCWRRIQVTAIKS